MNVTFINPFLGAVVNVLKTMAFTDPTPGKPFVKTSNELSQGDVTGVIGLTGPVKGSIAVSFTEAAILHVVSNMFGEPLSEINCEVEDAVGELSNMICGDARR
jgi:chemotaxis protein CheX